GGLGIGLTLVKSLVELHGGGVEAHSAGPGQGSEFVIRLPAPAEARRPEPVAAPGGPHPAGTASRRRLVGDGNRDSAESLALFLKITGHEVRTAHDGAAGIEAAREYRPEVIFLDIGLPRLDGYEVARRLRCEPGLADVLLVAMTGYGQDEDR